MRRNLEVEVVTMPYILGKRIEKIKLDSASGSWDRILNELLSQKKSTQ